MQSFSAIEYDLEEEEEAISSAVHGTSVGRNKDKKRKESLLDLEHMKQKKMSVLYLKWHFPQSREKAIES